MASNLKVSPVKVSAVEGVRANESWRGEYLRDLIIILTEKEIKGRYKNSWLGYAWSVLNPLAFATVYYLAFGVFMRVQITDYPLFLVAGLFPWQWVSHSMSAAPNIFLANATLLKKVRFARHILVVSAVLSDGLHFLMSIPVILVFLAIYHVAPTWFWLIGVPALTGIQLIMVYGMSLLIASLNLFLRDLDRLTILFMAFLFFLTPIAYTSSMIPERYQVYMYLNPFTPLILNWQQLFLTGTLSAGGVLAAGMMAALMAIVGYLIYSKLAPKFAEVI
jgi:lipopolysaccharide transport system permease protein